MSINEEEEETSPRGRPNAFFAEQKARERTGFGSDFRAVPIPRGGAQGVKADETIGDYDTCWCGLPADHDWPGKDQGRKHPKEQKVSVMAADRPKIDRRQLNGFDDEYKELILKAVNEYGVRYRLSNRGIMLYPPDGSEPRSIPQRTNPRTIKTARIWFVKHVALERPDKALSPAEQEAAEEAGVAPLVQAAAEAAKEAQTPVPVAPAEPLTEGAAAARAQIQSTEWVQARYKFTKGDKQAGEPIEGWETDGTRFRCIECGEVLENSQRIGGHDLKHNPEKQAKLWGPESQEKKRETARQKRLTNGIEQAVKTLAPLVGIELDGNSAEVVELRAQLAKVTAERDDFKARLDLMREAMKL